MAALNYAEQYARALANAYPSVLHFAALRSAENDSRYQWVNGNTIKIPTLTTTGRVDADRDTITVAKRNYNNAWELKTLRNHRKWSTLLHPMDIDETNQVASIKNITQVYNETQKFPKMDSYLISCLYADWVAAGGKADTTVLTEENILQKFDAFMEAMDEARVPASSRILYVTPAINTVLKNARELSRSIKNGESAISRSVHFLDDVRIESVPSSLMKTIYDFTEGAVSGVSAKQIHMMLVHNQPYAHYQYQGEVMGPNFLTKDGWRSRPKSKRGKYYTGRVIQYNGAPMRGKKWIPRMMADHSGDIEKDVAAFISYQSPIKMCKAHFNW